MLDCGVCSLPCEYCEYNALYDKCKAWMKEHAEDEFERLVASVENMDLDGGDAKKKVM